jgi:hypothetical protein
MKKTDARGRRKKTPKVFMPFLPAWVYLIDDSPRIGPVRAWPWLNTGAAAESLKRDSPRKD